MPCQDYKAKPIRLTAVEWAGDQTYSGITAGRECYEWHGHECGWGERVFLTQDEFGVRRVFTPEEFEKHYEPAY